MSYYPANIIVITLWGLWTLAVMKITGADLGPSLTVAFIVTLLTAIPITFVLGLFAGLVGAWRND